MIWPGYPKAVDGQPRLPRRSMAAKPVAVPLVERFLMPTKPCPWPTCRRFAYYQRDLSRWRRTGAYRELPDLCRRAGLRCIT